jgi:DNA end-binding protein Ku
MAEAIANRPMWQGQLRLSLVSIPVQVYPATKEARTRFHRIHEPTMERVRNQKSVDGIGAVPEDEIRKGYQYEKGQYVLLTDEEIDAVRLETRKTLDLVQTVEARDIPPQYFDSSYYMVPADELAADAFVVIRDALKATGKLGIGQLAMRGHENIAAVEPWGKGMIVHTLRYADEVRSPNAFFGELGDAKGDPEAVAVAAKLMETMSKPFKHSDWQDHYQVGLQKLVAEKVKAAGKKAPKVVDKPVPHPGGDNVIDLMKTLKAALEKSEQKPAPKGRSRSKVA